MLLLDDFSLSQKMSCHAQRAVCLSQRPENAGSYAAPRTHQSLSLWKAAQWGFFHKYIYYIKILVFLLHYKQYLVSDPNSWKPEMLHIKSLKKELASSSVWKACHKKMSLDCKNKMDMEDRQLQSYFKQLGSLRWIWSPKYENNSDGDDSCLIM